ncbi:MAG: SPFH domain-containing protein [Clostridia bacterium]|nr:SPFH domain-containing protein [Clostridia bacterium]
MGIIKAAMNTVGGALADSWLEVIEPSDMDSTTVMCPGVSKARNDKRNTNTKGTANNISNGSIIHVYDNQMMLLIDGGAIVDYTAEPGYFEVKNSAQPSLFNGQFGDSLKEAFNRFKFSGVTPTAQRVVYINLKPMEGIKYGTKTPINYYDANYDIDVNVRAFGKFSLEISDPLRFYKTIIPTSDVTNMRPVDMETLTNQRWDSEFLTALQQALTELSAQGVRISQIGMYNSKLVETLKVVLKDTWNDRRGIELCEVGITVSYDEETKELLKERNKVAMFNNPSMRETMVQKNISEGLKDAGSNANGAMAGFMGMGMGMNFAGGYMNNASNANMQQMQMQQQQPQPQYQQQPVQQQPAPQPQPTAAAVTGGWKCECGKEGNTGKFCAECGKPKPVPVQSGSWTCSCGAVNSGKFCAECGNPRPADKPKKIKCDKCGYEPDMSKPIPKFCPECGDPINEADFV